MTPLHVLSLGKSLWDLYEEISDRDISRTSEERSDNTFSTDLDLSESGSGLNEMSSLVPVAIKIEFPETWSTAWIMHVEKLECLFKLAVVTDVSIETEKLKENPVQVTLTDTPPI